MSLAKIYSGAVYGVDAHTVEIEVNAGGGEPRVVVVGLPDAAVKESTDRVWTALINSGFFPPDGRTTVNLAPADIKKEGPSFDLPIALGMLAANKDIEKETLDGVYAIDNLRQAVAFLEEGGGLMPVQVNVELVFGSDSIYDVDFSDVKGQPPTQTRACQGSPRSVRWKSR